MHELSLMEGVLSLILDAQAQHGFQKVERVILEIGDLAGVETEALTFCWEAVMAGTPAESAVLELVAEPAKCWCGTCCCEVPVQSRWDLCPDCGLALGPPFTGTDLKLKSLEVE